VWSDVSPEYGHLGADAPDRIQALLAKVEPVFREGVITLERAHVLLYRAGERDATGRSPAGMFWAPYTRAPPP
jgi:hypothetical protein